MAVNEPETKPLAMADLQPRFENGDRSLFILSLLLLFLLQRISVAVSQQQLQQPLSSGIESVALFSLRSSLGLRSRDWPRKADPCSSWVGVVCQSGRVVGLQISGLGRTRLGKLNPRFSVEALSNLTLLTSFNASGFALPGPIPNLFGQLVQLRLLDLSSCSVNGSIPASFGNLGNLTLLYLSGNALSGTLPPTLGNLTQLTALDLSHNSLSGFIPSSFAWLRVLTLLNISANRLTGPVPLFLGTFTNLSSLALSNNDFTGTIPDQLADLSRLVELDLGFNSLSGSLPVNLGSLRNLQKLVLGNNLLTGPLPDGLSNLIQLQTLVLDHNTLSGAPPNSIWALPELRLFDVSDNNFTGTLPAQISPRSANASSAVFNLSHNQFYGSLPSRFGTSQKLDGFDLSGNYFEGRIPDGFPGSEGNGSFTGNCLQQLLNQRSFEDCSSFYAARGLQFDGFGGAPNASEPPPGSSGGKNNHLKFILAGVFGGLGFIVLVVAVLVLFLRRHERGTDHRESNPNPVTSGVNPPPPRISINLSSLGEAFTYEQLLQTTADFSINNLMKHGHSGDLYQGMLEGGIPVVVKRIDVRVVKRDSYMVELDLFGRASHNRLVPFLGHCLEHENEKLFVYKYMPNGDLSNALYRKTSQAEDGLQSLDWITRLKIAIGAAEALSYLHHECTPPLVHRDVQASSILLDDKFEVRLGSLSEVCVQEGDTHQSVISRLLRLSQTSDHCISGSLSTTCAYDVYCLGKVLLELVTGKLGISGSHDASTNEWLETVLPYINIYEKELVTKIVDPSLIVDEDLLEEVWAMAIVAKSCLNPKPSKRPLMRYILKALENPLKVVREENVNSARLRTTSSRGSWNAALFGSWRHSSSEIIAASGPTREAGTSSMKRSGTAGSQGSGQGGAEVSSSHKRLSKEIFPEPSLVQDNVERQED